MRTKKALTAFMGLLPALAVTAGLMVGCGQAVDGPAVEQTNRQLRLLMGPYQSSYLSAAIAAYQKQYPDVEVVVDDQSEKNPGEVWDTLRTQLMAGKGPDLIYNPSDCFDDLNKAMGTGVFADITSLLKRDFGPDELNQAVLQAGEWEGRQYVLPLSYNIPLLLTTEELLEETGIDPDRFQESQLSYLEEVAGYAKRTKNQPPIYDRPLFGLYFPDLLGIPILDYEKRAADFSAPEFRQAVEQYKAFYPYDFTEDDDRIITPMDGYEVLSKREAVFSSYDFNTGEELFWCASALSNTMNPKLLAIPSQDGKFSAWVYRSAAINAMSENQENAWNFLKILLSPEQQNADMNQLNLPVRSSCLNDRIALAKKDTDGTLMDVGTDGETVALSPLPDQFYEEFLAIVGNVGHSAYTYAYTSSQAFLYLRPYYEGEKSLDSCMEELQNAMNIYLSE